jgi:SAM-dependent methyltransferase
MGCCTTAEKNQKKRFEVIYERGQLPVIMDIERIVFGSDYGANSWTTAQQVEDLCKLLALDSGDSLLDIGSGTGWPGLYIADQSGCEITLVDIPLSALKIALDRTLSDNLERRSWVCAGNATSLPFKNSSFDVIHHSDILCCLPAKHDVLVSCRDAIRPGGRMAFSVVALSPDLSSEDTARAIANGPEFVESGVSYTELLEKTGWKVIEYRDLSLECAILCKQLRNIDQEWKEQLVKAIGHDGFEDRQNDWQSRLYAIEERLLRREFFLTTPF